MSTEEKGGVSFWEEITQLRWRVLPLIMMITFGSYYVYDFPGAVGYGKKNTIQQHFLANNQEFTETMNQALYSVYNYPNMILALFGGILIDKIFGIRKATLLFTTLIFSGSVLFWIGVANVSYPTMLAGRVLFGLGGESQSVAQSAYTSRWFAKSPALAVAFGICLSFSRVGSSFTFLFMPGFSKDSGINFAVFTGVVATGISLVACLLLVVLDYRAEKRGDIATSECDEFHWKQVVSFPLLIWLITFVCLGFYMGIFPFISIAVPFFQEKYDVDADTASAYVSIYQFVSAGMSPLLGFLVDRTGKFCLWMTLASIIICVIHVLFVIASIPPPVMLAGMGIGYSLLASSLWPAVPYIVPQSSTGSAYGLMTAVQNFGSGTMALVVGAILDAHTPPSNCTKTSNSTNTTIPPTLAPTTLAPTTLVPTLAPTTLAPTTLAPTTLAPTTLAPTTLVPTLVPTVSPSTSTAPTTTHSPVFDFFFNTTTPTSTVTPTPNATIKPPKCHDPNPTLFGFEMAITLFIGLVASAVFFSIVMWIVDKRGNGKLMASPEERKKIEEETETILPTNA